MRSAPARSCSRRAAGGLDAVVVTHGHLDHIGSLPVLHRSFPGVPVYATPPTIGLAEIMLRDAAKLIQENSVDHC